LHAVSCTDQDAFRSVAAFAYAVKNL